MVLRECRVHTRAGIDVRLTIVEHSVQRVPPSFRFRSSRSFLAFCSAFVCCESGYRCSPRADESWVASNAARLLARSVRLSRSVSAASPLSDGPAPPSSSHPASAARCCFLTFVLIWFLSSCSQTERDALTSVCARSGNLHAVAPGALGRLQRPVSRTHQ